MTNIETITRFLLDNKSLLEKYKIQLSLGTKKLIITTDQTKSKKVLKAFSNKMISLSKRLQIDTSVYVHSNNKGIASYPACRFCDTNSTTPRYNSNYCSDCGKPVSKRYVLSVLNYDKQSAVFDLSSILTEENIFDPFMINVNFESNRFEINYEASALDDAECNDIIKRVDLIKALPNTIIHYQDPFKEKQDYEKIICKDGCNCSSNFLFGEYCFICGGGLSSVPIYTLSFVLGIEF